MKKNLFLVFALLFTILLSHNVNAQSLKDLKNKAKKVVSEKTKETNNSGSGNQTSSKPSGGASNLAVGTKGDSEFEKWFNEKYTIIWQPEYFLDKYSLERGNIIPDKQLEGAKLLDYPNTIKTLNEKMMVAKASVQAYKIEDLLNYEAKFTELFQSILKPHINAKIEEAYKFLKEQEGMAVNAIIGAEGVMKFVQLIIPENADVQALAKDVEKTAESILTPYYARIYANDFHKQNIGKILYSDKPIVIGKEDPAQFKTSFGPNDKMYAVVYLKSRFKDYPNAGDKVGYAISIDNGQSYNVGFKHNPGDELLSYYLIEIIPDPAVAFHSLDPQEFGKLLSGLSPRKHSMKIKFGTSYNTYFAEGEVTLEYEGFDGSKIKENNDLAAKKAQDNWAKNLKLPDSFSEKASPFKDTELSTEKIKALIMTHPDFKDKIAQITKVQVTGTGEDWYIHTNSVGIPTHKSSNKKTGFIFKGKDGWCYFVASISFMRDYAGGGTYTKARIANSNYYPVKIHCDNVKQ